MKQVEIFSRNDVVKLQTQINEFLSLLDKSNNEVIDVKFSSSESEEKEPVFSALILYSKS